MRAAIILAILIGSIGSAHAGNGSQVGVISVGDNRWSAMIRAAIEEWLLQHGHGERVLSEPVFTVEAVTALLDCFAVRRLDCAHKIVDTKVNLSAVVYAELKKAPDVEDYTLTAYWLEKGVAKHIEQTIACAGCNAPGLISAAETLTAKLVPGPIKLTSPPPGELSEDHVRDGSTRSGVLPLTLMGAGAAAVVAGGIVAADKNSLPLGAGLSVGGIAAVGIGVYLWSRAPETTSLPVAIMSSDTVYLGWLGRF